MPATTVVKVVLIQRLVEFVPFENSITLINCACYIGSRRCRMYIPGEAERRRRRVLPACRGAAEQRHVGHSRRNSRRRARCHRAAELTLTLLAATCKFRKIYITLLEQ